MWYTMDVNFKQRFINIVMHMYANCTYQALFPRAWGRGSVNIIPIDSHRHYITHLAILHVTDYTSLSGHVNTPNICIFWHQFDIIFWWYQFVVSLFVHCLVASLKKKSFSQPRKKAIMNATCSYNSRQRR